jgi:hypothetical protein
MICTHVDYLDLHLLPHPTRTLQAVVVYTKRFGLRTGVTLELVHLVLHQV